MTYAIIPLGLLTKPLGSLFIGFIGDRWGRKKAIVISLVGMALVTLSMGCLPTYKTLGPLSPFILILLRSLQGFFSAGETVGAAIFVLENTPKDKRGVMNGLFDASSISGMMIASILISIFTRQNWMVEGWRLLFFLGGLPAIWALVISLKTSEGLEFKHSKTTPNLSIFKILYTYRQALLSVILVSGFSYMTYHLAFTLMNGYIPLVTSCKQNETMSMNIGLLILDMVTLPLFGFLAQKIGKKTLMISSALLLVLGSLPIFYFLPDSSFVFITLARVYIVLCGVAFAASYFAWGLEHIPSCHRYTLLAFGGSLGSQCIGASTPAICLWLHKHPLAAFNPSFYIAIVSFGAIYGLMRLKRVHTSEPI